MKKSKPADIKAAKKPEEVKKPAVKAEEPMKEKKVVAKKAEPKEDRSMFNCELCKGEGIEIYGTDLNMERICTMCHGTGKV